MPLFLRMDTHALSVRRCRVRLRYWRPTEFTETRDGRRDVVFPRKQCRSGENPIRLSEFKSHNYRYQKTVRYYTVHFEPACQANAVIGSSRARYGFVRVETIDETHEEAAFTH